MTDQILIRGLKIRSHVGVPDEERAEAQDLRAHVTLMVPPFPKEDDIYQTVDYKAVADGVREVASVGERQLIETLAQEIAQFILATYPVEEVAVEIEKDILEETDWVGVVIYRSSE